MTRFTTAICVSVCLSITAMGCDGITEPAREIPRKAGSVEGWSAGLWNSVAAIGMTVAGDIWSSRNERAMRPKVSIRVPDTADVNEPIRLEAAYHEQGKAVPDCWDHIPYTVTIRRESDGAVVKPESEERRGDGSLIITFKAGDPGDYVVEVRAWAAGMDTARTKPKAAAHRTVKVR